MPTKSPTLRIQMHLPNKGHQRVTFEFTGAQERALTTTSDTGQVAESVAFETARGLTRKGLLRQRGPHWFLTDLGRDLARRIRAKRRSETS